jgi:hypothetical protein
MLALAAMILGLILSLYVYVSYNQQSAGFRHALGRNASFVEECRGFPAWALATSWV